MNTAGFNFRNRTAERAIFHLIGLCVLLICANSTDAQSSLRDFPTAITSNEISGSIAPRPLGDSRITTYYYYFNGEQGDIFINVVTENLAGDIDVFSFDGLRLLTRMVLLAESEPTETGRVVYLRKPEKLLIRIQGRAPNDDPAKFRLKFAGSFLAVKDSEATPVPDMPTVPKPVVEERAAETAHATDKKAEDVKIETEPEVAVADETVTKAAKPEVKITDLAPAKTDDKAPETAVKTPGPARTRNQRRSRNVPPVAEKAPADTEVVKSAPAKESDPMAEFGLVIVFKDGSKIERPMTEILRFTVDKGMLTVVGKDGRIGRYSMRDVERVGIE